MTPTTRTFCRNSALAWPRTADYACALERPADNSDLIVMAACAAAGVILLALAALEWLA